VESRGKILQNLEKCRNYVVLGARDESLGEFARDIATRLGEGRPGSRARS
jgi:hypothetical protein